MREAYQPIDPIKAAQNALPFVVRDYFELCDEAIAAKDDPEHKAHIDEQRFGLIEHITKDPLLNKALGEFVIFRNDTLKAREGGRNGTHRNGTTRY